MHETWKPVHRRNGDDPRHATGGQAPPGPAALLPPSPVRPAHARRSARWIQVLLGLTLSLYAALAVIPFFGNGLATQAERVRRGEADPSSLPPFDLQGAFLSGRHLHVVATLFVCVAPLLLPALAGAVALIAHDRLPHTTRRERIMLLSSVILAVGAALFVLSPLGVLIQRWIFD